MVQHFRNGEAEWCSFDASSPDNVGLEEGSLVEDAELTGSDEGKWCTTYISAPEAMPKNPWLKTLNCQEARQMVHNLSKCAGGYARKTGDSKPLGEIDSKIDAFFPETMSQHFWNEGAEWCSFDPSYTEDVGLEEGSLIEEAELSGSDEGKCCITYLGGPKDMPEKVVISNQLVKKTLGLSSLKHMTDKVE
jgi:hypothetical protein